MIIQQIRSAALKITYGGVTFLVDPWLSDQGDGPSLTAFRPDMEGLKCPIQPLPDTPEHILERVDYALVTHLHFDHFSGDYLPEGLRIIAQNEEDAKKLREMEFLRVRGFTESTMRIRDVDIRKVPAIHGDSEEIAKRMGETSGYVLTAPGEKCLYIAGDTVYCPQVEETIRQYQPAVIILNCCEARVPGGRLIMDLTDLEKVCQAAPEALVIASHMDNVNHACLLREDVRGFVKENGLIQVRVPEDGECVTV